MSGRHAPEGERIYEPVADIAQGGMGRVELVVRREQRFARVYAMKRLRPELSEDRDVREMFLEEARIAGLIRHPNVVPVLDVGEDDEGPFLVMDFVEGVSAWAMLLQAAKEGHRLDIALCVEVVRQCALGLAAAHELRGAGGRELSVVHRDVSPQNILLGFDGHVRLSDFGVARALDRAPDRRVTGKTGYMSPEQVQGLELDERSDLFSLGIVLYELLATDRLYPGERDEAFARIRNEPPPDVREVRKDVPAALAELVTELLEKAKDARPASSALVAARLGAIASELKGEGSPASIAVYLRTTFKDEQERQRDLIAAALERTEYDVSLLASSTPNETLTTDRPASGDRAEAPTAAIRSPLAAATDTEVSEPPTRRRSPRKLAVAVALGLLPLALLLGLHVVFSNREPTADPPHELPGAGCETAACRAEHGAMYACDEASAACVSPISPVCPEVFPSEAGADPDAIVIGTLFDRSTENQLARENAARLAVAGLNRAGGIDGRTVLLVHCDLSTASATDAAGRLIRAGAVAIIGPSSSSDTAAVFSTFAGAGVLVISPSATAAQLGALDRDTPSQLFRTAPPDGLQAEVILRELTREPRAASVAVVRRSNDVYAQSLSVLVQEGAAERGLAVRPSRSFVDASAVAGAAAEAAEDASDAVVFLSSQVDDAVAFLDAASALDGLDGARLLFADASANDDLVARVGPGAARFAQARLTRPAPPSTIVTSELVSEYASMFGGDPLQQSFTAHTYDATALVLVGVGYAIHDGGALDGSRIAEGIRRATSGRTEQRLLSANLPSIIAAVRAEPPDVDVVGASGTLDYDPDSGELTSATYEVLSIEGAPPRLTVRETVSAPLAE
ncbi:MAG: bifunctional serine/threonine-protein kinase/ABC transporter substrate-binding protein [Sandaracinaceae bacterium]